MKFSIMFGRGLMAQLLISVIHVLSLVLMLELIGVFLM